MRKTENKEYYQKIRERVHSVTITHYLNIDQDKELLDLETRRPDFGLMYQGKYVGIEVTEVRPHKYYNDKKIDLQAINNTLERLIRQRLDANTVKAFRIDVIPQESIYSGVLDIKNPVLLSEIDEHLQGNSHSWEYIKQITAKPFVVNSKVYTRPNSEVDIYIEWEGGFLETIPTKPVIEAIRSKEEKVDEYLKENDYKFDELWLFITMPNEEHLFSFRGFVLPPGFESIYDKIYVGELVPPFANCIYNKLHNP